MGMTLTEMVTIVANDRTDRPDMTSAITGYIQQAAAQLHSTNDFAKDITVSTGTNPSGPAYSYDFDLSTLTRYRKVKKVIFLDANGNELVVDVDKRQLDSMLDYNNLTSGNYWMPIGGNKIRVVAEFPFSSFNVYYYQWPQMGNSDATFTSWIASEYPWVFIDLAVRSVKNNTGDDSSAAMINTEIKNHMTTVIALGDTF